MSAFSRLWRRAPLWRLSLAGMVAFSGLTALYPPDWMVSLYPPLGKFAHHPLPSSDSSDPGSDASGDQSSTRQGNDDAPPQVIMPPIEAQLIDIMPIAGRQLPLPAGIWHPVLQERIGPHREISRNILVRTDRGVVTGVILVQATTASVPSSMIDNHPCQQDGVFFQRKLTTPAGTMECLTTNVVFTPEGNLQSHDEIEWAFGRLTLLGFPMPPVWGVASWIYAQDTADGGKNFEVISMSLSPADPGTARVKAPLSDWTAQGLGTSPFTGRFMQQITDWISQWAPVLVQGYKGELQPMTDQIRPGASDPAWHGTADAPPT